MQGGSMLVSHEPQTARTYLYPFTPQRYSQDAWSELPACHDGSPAGVTREEPNETPTNRNPVRRVAQPNHQKHQHHWAPHDKRNLLLHGPARKHNPSRVIDPPDGPFELPSGTP